MSIVVIVVVVATACPERNWGEYCNNTCLCNFSNTIECRPDTGECACAPGWRGPTCEETCQPPSYGDACAENCTCEHGGECHHVTGKCTCAAGYVGDQLVRFGFSAALVDLFSCSAVSIITVSIIIIARERERDVMNWVIF